MACVGLGFQSRGLSAPSRLEIDSSFEGASVSSVEIDEKTRSILFTPGGDPSRGWPCWWYFKINGVEPGEVITLHLKGSSATTPQPGGVISKPLSPVWAMPERATFSHDGVLWQHSEKGARENDLMHYTLRPATGSVYVAWGPPYTPGFAAKAIEATCKDHAGAKAGELCRKVRMAVENVEQNRGKFSHIDDRELGQRKGFCDRVDASVAAMRADYASRETQGKLESDQRKELAGRMQSDRENAARANSAYTKGNASYLADQGQQQATIRREQDQSLDKLSGGLDMLKEMGTAIHDELQTQEKMAEDIEKKIDENQNKFDTVTAGIEKLTGTKDRCQLATIFALVVIFVIVTAIAVS